MARTEKVTVYLEPEVKEKLERFFAAQPFGQGMTVSSAAALAIGFFLAEMDLPEDEQHHHQVSVEMTDEETK